MLQNSTVLPESIHAVHSLLSVCAFKKRRKRKKERDNIYVVDQEL